MLQNGPEIENQVGLLVLSLPPGLDVDSFNTLRSGSTLVQACRCLSVVLLLDGSIPGAQK
jgi:hypothetical protein